MSNQISIVLVDDKGKSLTAPYQVDGFADVPRHVQSLKDVAGIASLAVYSKQDMILGEAGVVGRLQLAFDGDAPCRSRAARRRTRQACLPRPRTQMARRRTL